MVLRASHFPLWSSGAQTGRNLGEGASEALPGEGGLELVQKWLAGEKDQGPRAGDLAPTKARNARETA